MDRSGAGSSTPITAIELRNLTADDTGAIGDLLSAQRAEYIRGFRPFAEPLDWLDALERADLDVYQGIWFESVLMGVVMLRGWDAGYDVPALGIMVDETYAGTGIADAAIRLALCTARTRGARRVMLHCDLDNARARRCFERHGFRQVGDPFDGTVRMEVVIVGAQESQTDLRTLYDPDVATVQRNMRQTYGMEVSDRYARDFVRFTQETTAGMVLTDG